MGSQVRVPFRRRQLARELRRLRERSGLTQAEAGKRLVYSEKKMSRFELGQVPDYHALRAMLDLYGLIVNDWEPYLDLWERAQQRGWWTAYGLDDCGYVSMEDEAATVREFQNGFVPGLLQTERYARALFDSSVLPRSAKVIENQLAARMRRQERLIGDPALRLDVVIEESVLRRCIDPEVRGPQLRRILERAGLENVTVRVLPEDIGLHDGVYGPFIVLSFPDAEEPDMGYVEHALGAVHVEDADQVAAARLRYDHLADLALDEGDSRALIERVITQP